MSRLTQGNRAISTKGTLPEGYNLCARCGQLLVRTDEDQRCTGCGQPLTTGEQCIVLERPGPHFWTTYLHHEGCPKCKRHICQRHGDQPDQECPACEESRREKSPGKGAFKGGKKFAEVLTARKYPPDADELRRFEKRRAREESEYYERMERRRKEPIPHRSWRIPITVTPEIWFRNPRWVAALLELVTNTADPPQEVPPSRLIQDPKEVADLRHRDEDRSARHVYIFGVSAEGPWYVVRSPVGHNLVEERWVEALDEPRQITEPEPAPNCSTRFLGEWVSMLFFEAIEADRETYSAQNRFWIELPFGPELYAHARCSVVFIGDEPKKKRSRRNPGPIAVYERDCHQRAVVRAMWNPSTISNELNVDKEFLHLKLGREFKRTDGDFPNLDTFEFYRQAEYEVNSFALRNRDGVPRCPHGILDLAGDGCGWRRFSGCAICEPELATQVWGGTEGTVDWKPVRPYRLPGKFAEPLLGTYPLVGSEPAESVVSGLPCQCGHPCIDLPGVTERTKFTCPECCAEGCRCKKCKQLRLNAEQKAEFCSVKERGEEEDTDAAKEEEIETMRPGVEDSEAPDGLELVAGAVDGQGYPVNGQALGDLRADLGLVVQDFQRPCFCGPDEKEEF